MNDIATAERTRRHIARELGIDSGFDAGHQIRQRAAYLAETLTTGTTALGPGRQWRSRLGHRGPQS